MSRPSAILDACVLVPIRLATTLLWLAEAGMFDVLWSEAILGEVERNLPNVGVSAESAARRVGMMREAFGAAALVSEFEHLIPSMTCDVKDRHVLAAAVRGGADTLVTFNLRDFPRESAAPHDINVIFPDLFLLRLLAEHDADVIARRHGSDSRAGRGRRRRGPGGLARTCPGLAQAASGPLKSRKSSPICSGKG